MKMPTNPNRSTMSDIKLEGDDIKLEGDTVKALCTVFEVEGAARVKGKSWFIDDARFNKGIMGEDLMLTKLGQVYPVTAQPRRGTSSFGPISIPNLNVRNELPDVATSLSDTLMRMKKEIDALSTRVAELERNRN